MASCRSGSAFILLIIVMCAKPAVADQPANGQVEKRARGGVRSNEVVTTARQLKARTDFAGAVAALEEGLKTLVEPASKVERLRVLNELGATYRILGKYSLARATLRSVLTELKPAAAGLSASLYAHATANLAAVELDLGRERDASPLIDESLRVRKRSVSDKYEIAEPLLLKGRLEQMQGRFADAETRLNQAYEIRKKTYGLDHVETAESMAALASLYVGWMRDLSKAEALAIKSLEIRERHLVPTHPDIADSLITLAPLYWSQGRYMEGRAVLVRALSIIDSVLGKDHPAQARALTRLAKFEHVAGNYEIANTLLGRCLFILEDSVGTDSVPVAQILLDLANSRFDEGQYGESERLATRSLSIFQDKLGDHHFNSDLAQLSLARALLARGETTRSNRLFKDALASLEKTTGRDTTVVGAVLVDFARLREDLGWSEEARELREESVSILERALGAEHPEVAAAYAAIARDYQVDGLLDKASSYYLRSLRIYQKTLTTNPAIATTLAGLASLYAMQADRKAELQTIRQLSDLYSTRIVLNAANEAGIREARANKDIFFRHLGLLSLNPEADRHEKITEDSFRTAQLLQFTNTAAAVVRMATRLGSGDDRLAALIKRRQDLADSQQRDESALVEAASRYSSDRDHKAEREIRRELAAAGTEIQAIDREIRDRFPTFHNLARVEPMTLREVQELLAEDEALLLVVNEPVPEASDTRREPIALQAPSIVTQERAIAAQETAAGEVVSLQGKVEIRRGTLGAWRAARQHDPVFGGDWVRTGTLSDVEIRHADGTRVLVNANSQMLVKAAQSSPAAAVPQLHRGRTWGSRKLDKPRKAIVLPPLEHNTWIWLVRRNVTKFISLRVDQPSLSQRVAEIRASILPTIGGRLQINPDVKNLHDLYRTIFGQIESQLEGTKHLMVSASGALESLPFSMLVASPPSQVQSWADLRSVDWLARHFAISELPSVNSLRALRTLPRQGMAQEVFAGFGDPLLSDEAGAEEARSVAPLFAGAGRVPLRQMLVANVAAIRQAPSLPETSAELKAMAKILGADESSIWLRERATESMVKKLNLSRYRIVAFATHGVMAGEVSGVVEPGLILTPPNEPTLEDDGYLSASEIASLRLNSEWVLLSACNTAAPDGTPDAEGLSGVAKAFLYAGSQALFVSHWYVDSDATVTLTTTMLTQYEQDPLRDKAKAHQKAMLSLIDGEHVQYAHPFFWAPFVVVGDARRH
jgi:CHAT domain-containing protein/tetratricopeptide (TPR) repeat protein